MSVFLQRRLVSLLKLKDTGAPYLFPNPFAHLSEHVLLCNLFFIIRPIQLFIPMFRKNKLHLGPCECGGSLRGDHKTVMRLKMFVRASNAHVLRWTLIVHADPLFLAFEEVVVYLLAVLPCHDSLVVLVAAILHIIPNCFVRVAADEAH